MRIRVRGSSDRYGPGMATQEAGDEEFEPLEIVPYPVPIEAHEPGVGGASTVRLFFQPGDRAAAPDVDIAEVVVLESWDRVSIGLVRRGLTGEGPGGVMYGESLMRRQNVTLDLGLAEPLGTRTLLDAWTGHAVARVERPPDGPLPAERAGTPLWRRS